MEVLKTYKSQLLFHLYLNIIFSIFITFASYYHIPLISFTDSGFYFVHFIALQFSIFGFLYFLSINKYVFKILFPILYLFISGIAYWVYFQDITISQSIIQVSLETKIDIVIDLISFPFVMYLILNITVIIFTLRLYNKLKNNSLKSPLTLLALLAIISHSLAENYRPGTFNRRLPYNIAVSLQEYLEKNTLILKPINNKINTQRDKLTVVFILGESVRANHLQINGYTKKTTPLLQQRKDIISFPNTYTPLTYTAISVPQILTDATLTDNYSQPKHSLIQVLNQANIKTNWIGNQTPEKSYEIFINQSSFHEILDPFHSDLSFQKEYDEKLLPVFKKNFNPRINQFTTIHMIGSHWWYETRYPEHFRVFKPVIKSKYIPSNTKEEMINSYDNTILYLDYFINETIKELEKQNSNTILIYLSDHGEILGEENLWLHAQQGKASENPAMLIWCSSKFKKEYPNIISNLKSHQNLKTNLDFFYHSILNLYQIEGVPYDKSKVIF
ncbi:phosphoethanolamine transferase [Flavobacterium sp. 5]|uniref:phosphoethanolamine transferase n=1 Tax=Flavobacterium sp. 5 TaxID=2035199 RepID=UPI000C2C5915|nr:phosphoethanolamine transferase [Flavobacterium sp. 5]PKB15685.1 phosphatidylethanolamine:Kdo2-lipid A phosphoethanolamine transferase [Flavobacterium sp. 5]